jgi:hypothetical protein
MTIFSRFLLRRICGAAALAGALTLCGCEDDDVTDYNPPPGLGALVVDNNTSNDIEVFIDGVSRGKAGDYDSRPFDVAPGVHRVVLDEKGGDMSYRDDIDILGGRLTVLDVDVGDYDEREYDVSVYFD